MGTLTHSRRRQWAWMGVVVASALLASTAASQGTDGVANTYYPGPNVTYTNEAPYKLLITVSRPTNDDADDQWFDFVRAVFQRYVSPTVWPGAWPVLVGRSEMSVGLRERANNVFKDWIAGRRLQPGAILALGGPSSRVTADTMINSFKHAPPNWAKGATLMFMGSAADKDRVFAALRPSGATLRFFDLDSVQAATLERIIPRIKGPLPPVPAPPPPPRTH
ncbi:hypothetical protein IHE49_06925 [Rhodanobacter sp. 7MK24]|uniref:hypothetical protein n=1 Tax=Rhodanobacter sp. 7MK24 TaxID=2775922 RepID=UPI00177B8ABC|nr:hypothetical protein [Rhodanobacter sp. 7MK24]MBD8880209.1 hypothetical protein [Rhodanobacter sp. 7MK24]